MRKINENLNIKPLSEFLYEKQNDENLNEGIKDWISAGLEWVKKTYNYLKSKIAQCGRYFVALWDDGIAPVVLPITGQQAFLAGEIRNGQVGMMGNKLDAKYSGITTSPDAILNKRPSTREANRQARMRLGESQEEKFDWSLINEEYLDVNPQTLNEMVKLEHPDTKAFAKLNVDYAQLSKAIKVAILKPTSKPLMIWGAPGIGKTAIVNSVLKEVKGQNSRLIDLPLATMTEDELFLPDYKLDEAGQRIGVRSLPHTYIPCYLPTGDPKKDKELDANCGEGVIFFDELSRAKPQMMNVCLKLIHERKLGEYLIGSGWSIISASNRIEDDPQTNSELSTALGNRFRQVNYAPTFKSWRAWAEKQGYISQDILNWLELNEKYFYMLDDEADYTQTLFPSPRSWDAACQTLADYVETGVLEGFDVFQMYQSDPDEVELVIASEVGSEAAAGFMEYLKIKATVDVEKLKLVWTNPAKAPLPPKKGAGYKLSHAYIYITTIASFMKDEPTVDEMTNLIEYLIRIDDENIMSRMISLIGIMFPDISVIPEDEIPQWMKDRGVDTSKYSKYVDAFDRLAEHYKEYDSVVLKSFTGSH